MARPCKAWSPSGLLICRENGVKAPACVFRAPAWKLGENGCGFGRQGPPPGPEVIANGSDEVLTGAVPDHGVKEAVVA
jgi:hypothetical protein